MKIGEEDLTVSVNETATYFKLTREHTIAPNLLGKINEVNPWEKDVYNVSTKVQCVKPRCRNGIGS